MKFPDKLKSAIFPEEKKGAKKQEGTPQKTTLVIRYDCGFNNWLAIRGSNGPLNWNKGIPLKNTSADEWIFETETPFSKCEYKILLNDEIYEAGENQILHQGTQGQHSPQF